MSANDLSAADLVEAVRQALLTESLPGSALRLELTESAAMADADQATRVLTELKDLGVAISIDDFGTGYSSLSYLQLLPVDMIKIDRSFVADLASSRVLVRSDEHTSELQSLMRISYAVFCLKKKTTHHTRHPN